MSHVGFKIWQCSMSLLLIFPNATCMLNLRKGYVPVIIFVPPCFMSVSLMSHVELRIGHVTLSILGVKSHL